MLKTSMKYIKQLIFGERAKGETLPSPSFRVVLPTEEEKLSQNEWAKYVKFGSRYGTKGSFYNNHPLNQKQWLQKLKTQSFTRNL